MHRIVACQTTSTPEHITLTSRQSWQGTVRKTPKSPSKTESSSIVPSAELFNIALRVSAKGLAQPQEALQQFSCSERTSKNSQEIVKKF
jgi:hypothetical protein